MRNLTVLREASANYVLESCNALTLRTYDIVLVSELCTAVQYSKPDIMYVYTCHSVRADEHKGA